MQAKTTSTPDRHTSRKLVRVPDEIHAQLERLAEDTDSVVSRLVRRFLIDGLKARGLWPPPSEPPPDHASKRPRP